MTKRTYQPLWEQIKADKQTAITNGHYGYHGTVALDIPPQLVARVDKAVRKEKNSYDGCNYPIGRYLKLQSSYDPETYELTFKLVPYRKYEATQLLLSKVL